MTTSLKALAENKDVDGVRKKTTFLVDPRIIEIEEGFNVRVKTPELQASIEDLAKAWHAGAEFPPIDVRVEDGRVILVEGHRRVASCLLAIEQGAQIAEIEARHMAGNKLKRIFHMLNTGEGARPITLLEQGLGYKQAVAEGMKRQEIADEARKSLSHVDQGLMLASATEAVQGMIARGEVAERVALTMMRKHGANADAMLKALVEGSGGKKVTDKAATGKKLPPKLVDRSEAAITSIVKSIQGATGRNLEILAQQPDDARIPVPASFLKELVALYDEIQKVRNPAESAADENDQQEAA